MEARRKQLLNDSGLYPEFYEPGQKKSSKTPSENVISISSSSSASSSASLNTFPRKAPRANRITIISDEESEDEEVVGLPSKTQLKEQEGAKPASDHPFVQQDPDPTSTVERAFPKPAPLRVSVPAPIELPTQKAKSSAFLPESTQTVNPDENDGDTFDLAAEKDVADLRMSPADAEKALRALVEDTVNSVDGDAEIDMKEAVVNGFREDIILLPHQVLGKVWMRERESGKKHGGILADDMGLGKTIQTLTRIVEGRAMKSDKVVGWAASTLVICPVALVSQWASEIQKMTVGLRVIEHYGQHRTTDPLVLQKAHVVITSYTTVTSEYASFAPEVKNESRKSKAKSSKSKTSDAGGYSDSDSSDSFTKKLVAKKKSSKERHALFRVKWYRIVLDEAHHIKNRNTKSAVACCALEGKYRWCLTGTPMQNTVEELYSLLRFLRIRPLNDWQTFNEQIAGPVKNGRAGLAMKRLHVVLKSVMLRRLKNQVLNGQPLLRLPERNLELIECQFDSAEKAFYTQLENLMNSEVDRLVKARGNVNYTHVLLLLLRLRQACNHPSLVSKDYRVDKDAAEPTPARDDEDGADDLAALFGQMGVSSGKKCQLCQMQLPSGEDLLHCSACAPVAVASKDPNLPDSAKIRKILMILKEIDKRSGAVEKTIIFSQFTSMLDLIEPFLDREGVKYVRYDGSMPKDKREASLEKIRKSKNTRCILISFKAGSTGLNLTACNNVILVDMWWNPALEDQAYDRAHRLGQTRNVDIYKLMVPDTVEARILQLQDTKRKLTTAALSGDKLKNMKLGMDDLLALFRGSGRDDDDN